MKKSTQIAAVVGACAIAFAAVGCSSSSTTSSPSSAASSAVPANTLTANGVSFQYPEAWVERDDLTTSAQAGNEIWKEAVGPAGSETDLAIMTGYTVNVEVTKENVDSLKSQVETTMTDLAKQANGSVTSPVTVQETAGFPGFTAQIAVKTQSGQPVESTVWLFFNGKTEYFLNCQYGPTAKEDMFPGCEQMRSTFKLAS